MHAATVISTNRSTGHTFSKMPIARLELQAGHGVIGDAHHGVKVRHRSRVAKDPTQPNLRQVHLLHAELFEALALRGFDVSAGDLGENLTTAGIDLLGLSENAELQIGVQVRLRVTGLRNPCVQLNHFKSGLMAAVLDRGADGSLIRKAGVMAVVLEGGIVSVGDPISIHAPDGGFVALRPV